MLITLFLTACTTTLLEKKKEESIILIYSSCCRLTFLPIPLPRKSRIACCLTLLLALLCSRWWMPRRLWLRATYWRCVVQSLVATAVVMFVFATLVECDGNGASGTNVDELPGKRVRTVCANMEQKICLYYDPTTKRLKKNPKNRRVYPFANNFVKYHIKEFHRKDHHHRLEKHVAYTLSVIALKRLEESAKALGLPTYFPRILEEINNYTYKIEHVGLQSDDVELEVNEVKKQVVILSAFLNTQSAHGLRATLQEHCL